MFNLIIKGPWANNRDSIWAERVFENTSAELIARYQPNGVTDFAALAQLPTIFAQESVNGDEVARVGTIMRAQKIGRIVELTYQFDPHLPGIPNTTLEGLTAELGIERGEFARNHWSIKDADPFLVLLRHASLSRQRPTVFRLPEGERIQRDQVSAMMPFDAGFNAVNETFERTARALGLQYHRADDIWIHDHIMQDIVELIDRSKVVIADCTGRNANVFYEIGIAHTLGRNVILVTQDNADIPFDLRALRHLRYLNNEQGLADLQRQLSARIRELIR